jgi:hypothetical protein
MIRLMYQLIPQMQFMGLQLFVTLKAIWSELWCDAITLRGCSTRHQLPAWFALSYDNPDDASHVAPPIMSTWLMAT